MTGKHIYSYLVVLLNSNLLHKSICFYFLLRSNPLPRRIRAKYKNKSINKSIDDLQRNKKLRQIINRFVQNSLFKKMLYFHLFIAQKTTKTKKTTSKQHPPTPPKLHQQVQEAFPVHHHLMTLVAGFHISGGPSFVPHYSVSYM